MKRLFAAIFITNIVFLFGCTKKDSDSPRTPMRVEVDKPFVKNVVLHRQYPGYVSAQNSVDIVARVSGYLVSAPFSGGSRISKGQLLFVIEPDQYKDAVDKAEAALENAQAQLDYAENNYVRMSEAARSDAISEIDLIQSATQLLSAKSNVKDAEAALSSARTTLGYCYIRAPYSGRITLGTLSNGNYVAGSASPVKLATLYEENLMYAYFNIEDRQFVNMIAGNRSVLGDTVFVSLQTGSPIMFTAVLDYVSPNIDLSTGTLQLRAEIDNREGRLKDGMYVNISLPYGKSDSAVLVRDASIGSDQLGNYVYVVSASDTVEYRHIETGELVDDTLRMVTAGLAADELYVTRALLKVRDGMRVTPVVEQ